MQDGTELSNGATKEVRRMASEVRFTPYCGAVAYVGDAGKLVQTQGLYMPAETSVQQQHQFTLLHERLSPGRNSNGVAVMDKDAGFMERAAAASASVVPERSAAVQVCDVGCAKSVGYAGGGFTEMIRGITRLPTAADVQSLMQAKASTSPGRGQGAGAVASGPGALRGSPTCSREMPHQKSDPPPHTTALPHTWLMRSPSQAEVDQVCEREADLVTLALLPNVPSRMCSSSMASHRDGSPSAQASSQGPYNLEHSWRQQVCSRVEPSAVLASRSVGSLHTGMSLATGCSLFPAAMKKVASGPVMPSMSSTVMQVAASSIMADGTTIDQGYLEQVYGGSTDPVVLLEDGNKVLWFNKAYDRALKSASERLSGKTISTGPYIDPLGHPTPLGNLVFPVYGKSVRATLWGFLKKLVIQESEVMLEHGAPGPSSQLRLSMERSSQRVSPVCMEPVSRLSPVLCSSSSRVTTVTLESITELHMDAPSTVECAEAAEGRLGAGNEPAFITDSLNRVVWVNGAFKQMLGHMSSDRISTHMMPSSKDVGGPMSSPTDGPSFVICCTEKVPRSAWAFSCRVNLEWIKGGKRRSMMVPCDVTRLVGNIRASGVNWVWQFDMAVSLCLNAPS